jgi:hypothetical protein
MPTTCRCRSPKLTTCEGPALPSFANAGVRAGRGAWTDLDRGQAAGRINRRRAATRRASPHGSDRVLSGDVVTYDASIKDARGTGPRSLEVNLKPHARPTAAFWARVSCSSHDITRHQREPQAVSACATARSALRKLADASPPPASSSPRERQGPPDCNEALSRSSTRVHIRRARVAARPCSTSVARATASRALERRAHPGYESGPTNPKIHAKDGSVIPVEFEGRLMPLDGKVYRLSVCATSAVASRPRRASTSSPTTTCSPGCPTARCCASGWTSSSRPRAATDGARSSSSTWTTSRW